jgi:hypothetical protein
MNKKVYYWKLLNHITLYGYEKNEQGYELFERGTKLYQNSRPNTFEDIGLIQPY